MALGIQQQTEQWLDQIVIGLNLCPFARSPRERELIDIVVAQQGSMEQLMTQLIELCFKLTQTPRQELETILLVVPDLQDDFDEYLDCLELANQLITSQQLDDSVQIASFHPKYQFEGTKPEDPENLTNRSPYPVFHLLRQQSITEAVASYGNTAVIPEHNKQTIDRLPQDRRESLFQYLKK